MGGDGTNATGGTPYLYGWIDFNGDGDFGVSAARMRTSAEHGRSRRG